MAGKTSYYHCDASGNVRALTDSNQNVTDRYTYDAFGNPVAQSGTTKNNFRFGGQVGYHLNPDSGSYYVRQREYQPAIIRWMSEDPIGFMGSKWNVYEYARSNPINELDPSGEEITDREKARLKNCKCAALDENDPAVQPFHAAAAAWVGCDGVGGLKLIRNNALEKAAARIVKELQLCGLFKCIEEHEARHIEQLQFVCPDVCKDECALRPEGGHIVWKSKFCGETAECYAYFNEFNCIEKVAMTWTFKGVELVRCKKAKDDRVKFINDIGKRLKCNGRTGGEAFSHIPEDIPQD